MGRVPCYWPERSFEKYQITHNSRNMKTTITILIAVLALTASANVLPPRDESTEATSKDPVTTSPVTEPEPVTTSPVTEPETDSTTTVPESTTTGAASISITTSLALLSAIVMSLK